MSGFTDLSPLVQALIATLGTWGLTAGGAVLVLFTRRVSRPSLDTSLGFAAGVMIAASFWGLSALILSRSMVHLRVMTCHDLRTGATLDQSQDYVVIQ
jgi:ZIP family zinc transporter